MVRFPLRVCGSRLTGILFPLRLRNQAVVVNSDAALGDHDLDHPARAYEGGDSFTVEVTQSLDRLEPDALQIELGWSAVVIA